MKITVTIFLKNIIIICLCNIFNEIHSKAILNIRIFNYKNLDNIKYNGKKCDIFHWANDHCDPMFYICVTAKESCDILKKNINHWKNKKTLFSVLNQNIVLKNVEKKISIYVRIDDHDKLDAHDFIGIFTADFILDDFNKVYRQPMKIKGRKLKISLDASLLIKCETGYSGNNCEESIDTCKNSCVGGDCSFNNERKKFDCKCKRGWSGIDCQEYRTDNCRLLNCKLKCNQTGNINHCLCIDKPYRMSCQELIPTIYQIEKKIITNTQTPIIKETTTTTITSKMSSISYYIQTEIIKNFIITDKSKSLNKIENSPESSKYFEKTKESNQNSMQNNAILISQAPSTIIIICLMLLLCICIISLLIVIRNWQKKSKTKFYHSYATSRPLPPILFQRNIKQKETFKSHVKDDHYNIQSNSLYETCKIQNTRQVNIPTSNYEIDNTDTYEEPIINQMDSFTCETDFNDSEGSDAYEIPTKSDK